MDTTKYSCHIVVKIYRRYLVNLFEFWLNPTGPNVADRSEQEDNNVGGESWRLTKRE